MEKTAGVRRIAERILLWVAITLPNPSVPGQTLGSVSNSQCSLAVVSRFIGNRGKPCDTATVLRFAQEGQVYEQNQLGIASILALGPDYNVRDAVRWFEKAALNGYAPAQVNLAVIYANGWGTSQNYGAALRWLKAASDQHYARADYNLGILYMQGTGVRRDYTEALHYFQRAAEAGDSSAQTNLGYLYDQGLGVAPNSSTAISWYKKAAESGNILGEYNLADTYLRGEGVAQNYAEALRWFQKSAEQGHTGARIKLAYMYAQGRGTKPDLEYAYSLLTAASDAGDKRGDELLSSLEHSLSSAQLTAAKARARSLEAAHTSFTDTRNLAP